MLSIQRLTIVSLQHQWWRYLDSGLQWRQALISVQICICVALKAAQHLYVCTFSGRKKKKRRKSKKEKAMETTKCQARNLVQERYCLPDGETCKLGTEQARHTVSLELSTVSKSSWCTCRCLIHLCDSEVAACITCLSMPLKSRNGEEMQSVNARNSWKTASTAVCVWPAVTTCLAGSPRLSLSFKRPCNFCSPGNHERPWLVTWHGSHMSGTFRRDSLNLLYMQ